MSDRKYNYFSLNEPNIVNNKPRYREEEYRKKNTYNFVTDPRLKRGRNYGIVYVTSTAFDENDIAMKKLNGGITGTNYAQDQQQPTTTSKFSSTKKKQQKKNEENLEQMGVPLPSNLSSVGSMTTEIKEILPDPVTFEMEVQTQDYIDLPQIPLFKPEKRGEDAGTQIEKGELFDFDEEVEPIINVLTFKTLEEARMEVLEEEEIKEMKRQMQDFEKVRNRELEIVQKLECQTIRKEEEKIRRNEERATRMEMSKIYQKKLISCVFAKNYLKNLKNFALKDLEQNGVLRKKEENEYHTKIVPAIKVGCEKLLEEENEVLFGLDNLLENNYHDSVRNQHKTALENEQHRKDEERRLKIEELERQRDEKLRRRQERLRKKHEKEMEELKAQIKDELISKGEFVDLCNEIYNMNFYGQKDFRGVPTILGHIGQIGIIMAILKNSFIQIFTEPPEEEKVEEPKVEEENKELEESKNDDSKIKKDKKKAAEEKKEKEAAAQPQAPVEPKFLDFNETLLKLIDLYLLKCAPFYLILPNEVMDKIKALDENLANIDDIWKIENEETFKNIINLIIDINLKNPYENVLDMVSEILKTNFETEDFAALLRQIYTNIFTICKTTTEFDPKEKVKFITIAALPTEEETYFGLCDIKQASIPKTKTPNDLAQQLLAKKNLGKKDAKGRPFFDPVFTEKVYICPLISDKMKILAMNTNYDKMFRNNLLNCLEKLESKFAAEGENVDNVMNEKYNAFVEGFKNKLQQKYQKDVLNVIVEAPNEDQAAK